MPQKCSEFRSSQRTKKPMAVAASGASCTSSRWLAGTYSPSAAKIWSRTCCQRRADEHQRLSGKRCTIIRFQVNEISASVPGPPGKARAASQLSTKAWSRSSRVSFFHSSPTQRLTVDRTPAFDLSAGHADYMTAGLGRAPRDRLHGANVSAGQRRVSCFGEENGPGPALQRTPALPSFACEPPNTETIIATSRT